MDTPQPSDPINSEDSALQFPCRFPIKAMGRAEADIAALVVDIAMRHAHDFDPASAVTRISSGGKYISVTVTINATSRAQLDAIYRALHANDHVLMAL